MALIMVHKSQNHLKGSGRKRAQKPLKLGPKSAQTCMISLGAQAGQIWSLSGPCSTTVLVRLGPDSSMSEQNRSQFQTD